MMRGSDTDAINDQLDAVVDDVLSRTGVSQVTLYGYSAGAIYVGNYAFPSEVNPSRVNKIKNIILQGPQGSRYSSSAASAAFDYGRKEYDTCGGGTGPTPCGIPPLAGFPIGILFPRDWFFNTRWGDQLLGGAASQSPPKACSGQRDSAILDPIWQAVRASDPVASNWGPTDPETGKPEGLIRAPSVDGFGGWNRFTAPYATVPTLFLSGLGDTIAPHQSALTQYGNIGSSSKVLVNISCASQYLMWETSPSANWPGGPHAILRNAAIEWIKFETYQGKSRGTSRRRTAS
jgi:pimeloyl-ACP methyl ester carboxylesterase